MSLDVQQRWAVCQRPVAPGSRGTRTGTGRGIRTCAAGSRAGLGVAAVAAVRGVPGGVDEAAGPGEGLVPELELIEGRAVPAPVAPS